MSIDVQQQTRKQEKYHDDLIAALDLIQEGWAAMLLPKAKRPGSGRGGGALLDDASKSAADMDRATAMVSTRREIAQDLATCCLIVRKKHTPTSGLPDLRDVYGMVEFLNTWAPRLADDAPADVMRRVKRSAKAVDRIVNPQVTTSLGLGDCPLQWPCVDDEGAEVELPCPGTLRSDGDHGEAAGNAWITCTGCHTRAVADWWARQAGADPDRTLTVEEIRSMAYQQFGQSITPASIWKWKQKDEIAPVNPDTKPHRFKLVDVSDLLTRKYG